MSLVSLSISLVRLVNNDISFGERVILTVVPEKIKECSIKSVLCLFLVLFDFLMTVK